MTPAEDTTPEVEPTAGAEQAPAAEDAVDGQDPPAAAPPVADEDEDEGEGEGEAVAVPLQEDEEVAEAAPEEPDFKDLYLRAAAEMDNLRKRSRRDVGAAEARGIGRLAKELLPALDNLDRAIAAAEALEGDDEHTLTRGTRLVQAELTAALERVGIKVEVPLGAPFDPHRHEALTQQPRENTAPGLVIEVYQPGYVYDDTVLRAAKVVVSA